MLINSPFIAAVEFIESQTESFSGANRERENSEQQRLLLQAAGGTGQTQTSHVQGENRYFWKLILSNVSKGWLLDKLGVATEFRVHISSDKHNLRTDCKVNHVVLFLWQHFKDLIRLRRTAEWPRSTLDSEASVAKETPEVELLPFTLSHERCICVVQKLALFLLSMDFTCHADLLLFVCKVQLVLILTFLNSVLN